MLIRPRNVLNEYLAENPERIMSAYLRGRLEIGLEIAARREMIDGAVGNSMLHLSKLEVVTVLDQLLKDLGLWEDVQLWYGRLEEFADGRRVRFVPADEA